MPRYKKDLEFLCRVSDSARYMSKLIEKAWTLENKAYISLLYITGARPVEMQIIRKKSCRIIDNDFMVVIETAKRGFTRTLKFDRAKTPFITPYIEPYLATLNDEDRLFKKDISTYKKMIYSVSDNLLTPYSFRHFRMTILAELGAFEQELKFWKGAKSTKSVEPYVHRSGKMVERFKDQIR